jgi:hypothetical protein
MADLNSLEGLGNDAGFEVDYGNVPPEPGGFTQTPPPGTYRFKLPGSLEDVWEIFDATINEKKVQRIRAELEGAAALTITQSQSGDQDGDSFRTRISNAERKRNKDGLMASDMLYLLRALGDDGQYKTNGEFANALKKYATTEFIANIEWASWCSDKKPIRVLVEAEDGTQTITVDENQTGCGKRVYQRDIPKENGVYAENHACPDCGAILRSFANLGQFKPLPEAK